MEEAHAVFERSLVALPNNLLLPLAYVESLEQVKNIQEAKKVYEKLLESPIHNQNPLVYIQYMNLIRRVEVSRRNIIRIEKE